MARHRSRLRVSRSDNWERFVAMIRRSVFGRRMARTRRTIERAVEGSETRIMLAAVGFPAPIVVYDAVVGPQVGSSTNSPTAFTGVTTEEIAPGAVMQHSTIDVSQAPVRTTTINLEEFGGNGLQFVFNAAGGMAQQAIDGFIAAADLWSSILTDDIIVTIDIDFRALGAGILGQASSVTESINYADYRTALLGDATSLDDNISSSNLPAGPSLSLYTSDFQAGSPGNPIIDNNNTANNNVLNMNTSLSKAVGLRTANNGASDAAITFSSLFTWDFDRSDGISAGAFDFIGVAAHEIGHALGFRSGADSVDATTGVAPAGKQSLDNFRVVTGWDIFRFSAASVANGADLDLRADGAVKYFSIDKGATQITTFSTGRANGDGQQASHWKDNLLIGIMDPTAAPAEYADITDFDVMAFDVMGWNVRMDFGDAPDTGIGPGVGNYNTNLSDNGPRHRLFSASGLISDQDGAPKVFLGAGVNRELDALQNGTATGDNDDGVSIPTLVKTLTINAQVTSTGGRLDYFVDFNGNGVFNDAGESFSKVVSKGTVTVPIVVPSDAQAGTTYARFRLSTAGGLGPVGPAADGEVEDYQVTIINPGPPGVTVVESDGSTDVTEGGATDSYTVVLDSQPTGDVVVTLSPDAQLNLGLGGATPITVTFTQLNWDMPQTITVAAVDDKTAEGTHLGIIAHSVASSDPAYDGFVVGDVSVNITDNDVASVLITESAGSTNVAEGGATDTYTVVLTSRPTANVVVGIGPDGQLSVGAGGGTPITLTFNQFNWNFPRTVTVTAVDDFVAEGPHTGKIAHATASSDPNYNSLMLPNVVANITDNDSVGVNITQSAGTTNVSENGATDTYTVVLNSQPTADVTITLTPDSDLNLGSGGATAIMLTFTAATWNVPQTVTVAAVDDADIEGPHTGTVTHSVSSSDAGYNGLTVGNVTANIQDNDLPGITLTESSGMTVVSESGTADSYTLVLDSPPTADVTITVTPDAQVNLGSGAGVAITLTFTSANWSVPQTVNVAAVNDAVDEGAHVGTITHAVSSGDANYDGMSVPNVSAAITDNDTAGIVLTQTGSTNVTEGGTTDTYTLVLTSQPTNNVVITITPDAQLNLGAGAGTAIQFTFTAGNWNVAQTVTVAAVNDNIAEGPHGGTISHAVASVDAKYNGFAVTNVSVSITDNDVSGYFINQTGAGTAVVEGGANDTYTVRLRSEPLANVTMTIDPDSQLDLGAGPGTAITLTFTPGNWNGNQTVIVAAVDDPIAEGLHSGKISHTLASTDPNYNVTTPVDITASITDNEIPTLTLTLAKSSISENGGSTTATVHRNTGKAGNLTVNLMNGDLTEAKLPASVIIPNGKDSVTFTINGVDDPFDDGTRTVALAAVVGGFVSGTATLSVTDDDAAQAPDDLLSYDDTTRTFKLGRNTGSAFTWFQTNPMPASALGYEPFLGDFDGDGDVDGALLNRVTKIVNWFKNNGNGTMTGPQNRGTATTAGPAGFFQVGDYDGNGRDEILWMYTTGFYAGRVFTKDLFSGQTFQMVVANPAYDAFLTGDFNGDGFDDLVGLFDSLDVTRTNIIPFYSIPSNNPNLPRRLRPLAISPAQGFFTQSIAGNGLGSFRVADLNADGRDDIVAVASNGQVHHATTTGSPSSLGDVFGDAKRFVSSTRSAMFLPPNFGNHFFVGRFDDNLFADALSVRNTGGLFVAPAALNPAFANPVVFQPNPVPFGAGATNAVWVMGDFNGDGYSDLASLNGNVSVFLSTGDGNQFGAALDFGPIIGGGIGSPSAIRAV